MSGGECQPDLPRDALIYEVATMISEATEGPAISAAELAEIIVNTVLEAAQPLQTVKANLKLAGATRRA